MAEADAIKGMFLCILTSISFFAFFTAYDTVAGPKLLLNLSIYLSVYIFFLSLSPLMSVQP